jgi:Arm DNA-binding domain
MRRVSFGQSLYLQVSPKDHRYWHYRYRFEGREKQLSLGRFPYVPVESAWARRYAARRLLKAGADPGSQKQALRRIVADGVWSKASYPPSPGLR